MEEQSLVPLVILVPACLSSCGLSPEKLFVFVGFNILLTPCDFGFTRQPQNITLS